MMANLEHRKPIEGDDFVARAQRAMNRAGQRAMADYKTFGLEPVVGKFRKKEEKAHSAGESISS